MKEWRSLESPGPGYFLEAHPAPHSPTAQLGETVGLGAPGRSPIGSFSSFQSSVSSYPRRPLRGVDGGSQKVGFGALGCDLVGLAPAKPVHKVGETLAPRFCSGSRFSEVGRERPTHSQGPGPTASERASKAPGNQLPRLSCTPSLAQPSQAGSRGSRKNPWSRGTLPESRDPSVPLPAASPRRFPRPSQGVPQTRPRPPTHARRNQKFAARRARSFRAHTHSPGPARRRGAEGG